MIQLTGLVGKLLVLLDVEDVKWWRYFSISGCIVGLLVRVCEEAGGEAVSLSLISFIEGHMVEVNY